MVNPGGNALPENPLAGTSVVEAGISGQSNTGVGVSGQSLGLVRPHFQDQPPSDGVRGEGLRGVHGLGVQNGVFGESSGIGVKGTSTGGDGVQGTSTSNAHAGVAGINDSGGTGVAARGTPAGHFEGNLEVTGNISGPQWNATLARITALESQVGLLATQVQVGNLVDKVNAIESLASRQQPFLGSLSNAPQVQLLSSDPMQFQISVPGFNAHSPVVTVRVSDRTGSFHQDIPVRNAVDGGGTFSAHVTLDLSNFEEQLFFALSDGTPSSVDWTGWVWSPTFVYP